jgi:hypothetical protein
LGVTQDLLYQGAKIASGDAEKRSHCSGLMYEVYLRACEAFATQRYGTQRYRLADLDTKTLKNFRLDFFGVSGNRRTMVDALTKRGLGTKVESLAAAQPGDLVQFWRNSGTGHSVVFLGLAVDEKDTERRGIRYWSVQRLNGVAENEEWIGIGKYEISSEEVFVVRPLSPARME